MFGDPIVYSSVCESNKLQNMFHVFADVFIVAILLAMLEHIVIA